MYHSARPGTPTAPAPAADHTFFFLILIANIDVVHGERITLNIKYGPRVGPQRSGKCLDLSVCKYFDDPGKGAVSPCGRAALLVFVF